MRFSLGKGDKKIAVILTVIAVLVTVIHVSIFSFRVTEDSPCWIAVAEFFKDKEDIHNLRPHCLFNPLIPMTASALSEFAKIPIKDSYQVMNVLALLLTGMLMFKIGKMLANRTVGLISAVLFLVDFHTQYYAFAVMPDVETWMVMLLFIFVIIKLERSKKISSGKMIGSGLLAGLATLTKMNLGFLVPILPILLIWRRGKNWLKKSALYLASAAAPVLAFYLWVWTQKGTFPWSSLITGIERQSPTIQLHAMSLIAAFLYTFPFILVGLKNMPIRKRDRRLILLIALGLVVPIALWPFVMSRFTFSLFILFFPVAANGIVFLSRSITENRKAQWGIIGGVLTLIFMMGLLRMYLTFTDKTHLEFIYEVFSNLQRRSV